MILAITLAFIPREFCFKSSPSPPLFFSPSIPRELFFLELMVATNTLQYIHSKSHNPAFSSLNTSNFTPAHLMN